MLTQVTMAQIFKIAAGLSQLGFASWLMIRKRQNAENIVFAIAFGANGIAYTIFNLALPGHRLPGSFAVQGRGLLNWVAVPSMVLFAVLFVRTIGLRTSLWLLALVTVMPMLAAYFVQARANGIDLLSFGGIAIYPANGFALALFAVVFARSAETQVRTDCALLSAALAINSVDHIGAGIVQPSPYAPATISVEIIVMSAILSVWLWNVWSSTPESSRLARLVLFCMIAPFLVGLLVRVAVGSYRGMQESGLIGGGRFAATALLMYGSIARRLFSAPRERRYAKFSVPQPSSLS